MSCSTILADHVWDLQCSCHVCGDSGCPVPVRLWPYHRSVRSFFYAHVTSWHFHRGGVKQFLFLEKVLIPQWWASSQVVLAALFSSPCKTKVRFCCQSLSSQSYLIYYASFPVCCRHRSGLWWWCDPQRTYLWRLCSATRHHASGLGRTRPHWLPDEDLDRAWLLLRHNW